jgi:broad specificity phosphatase PhoE
VSEIEYSTTYTTPLTRVGELPARQLLQFLATCSPRIRAQLLATLTK